jgi:hypothetical protein
MMRLKSQGVMRVWVLPLQATVRSSGKNDMDIRVGRMATGHTKRGMIGGHMRGWRQGC